MLGKKHPLQLSSEIILLNSTFRSLILMKQTNMIFILKKSFYPQYYAKLGLTQITHVVVTLCGNVCVCVLPAQPAERGHTQRFMTNKQSTNCAA